MRKLKPSAMLTLMSVALALVGGAFAFGIWWRAECEARRAPCTIELGSFTLRVGYPE